MEHVGSYYNIPKAYLLKGTIHTKPCTQPAQLFAPLSTTGGTQKCAVQSLPQREGLMWLSRKLIVRDL